MNEELVLQTERLLLRPLEVGDAELLWPAISDPAISHFMAWREHSDVAETVAFLKAELERIDEGRGVTWGVFEDGEFCGIVSLIGLVRGHRALTYNKAEFAIWLSRDFQGQGIASEAGRRVMAYGFADLGLHKIFVAHVSANKASEKMIKGLGFRYVGEQVEEFEKDGVWHNHKNYEILKREFEALSRAS